MPPARRMNGTPAPVPSRRNGAGPGSGGVPSAERSDQDALFFARFSAFFSAAVFCGFFIVCFLASCDLPMVISRLVVALGA